MKNYYALPTFIILLFFSATLSAQYYWVGGSGNWTDYTNHWATASGGSMFHSEAPGQDDDVYFDANSFPEVGAVVTIDEDFTNCRNLICTGITNEPLLDAASSSYFRIHDGFTLSADMGYSFNILEMRNSDGVSILTSNGASLGDNCTLYFNNTGTFELGDAIHTNRLQINQGDFVSNDHDIDCNFIFETSGTMMKSATLGNSVVNSQQFRIGGVNTAFDGGTATIHASMIWLEYDGSGANDLHHVIINNNNGQIKGNGNIGTLDISETASAYGSLTFDSGTTVGIGELTGTATRNFPFEITATSSGSEATLEKTSGTLDLEYVILKDIHATGGATFNALNCEDLGNNAGWNISDIVPWDFYWVGGEGSWEIANNWSDESGGSAAYDTYPSRFDNVIFDDNSFDDANQSVTVNEESWFASLDATGVTTGTPDLYAGYGNALNVNGDVDFGSEMEKSIHSMRFDGNGVQNIQLGSADGISYPSFLGDGVYNLNSDINCGSLGCSGGVINTNGHDIYCSFNFSIYSGCESVNFGDSEIDCLRWQNNSTSTAVDYGTSHVKARGEFKGNGAAYYEVSFTDEVIVYASNSMEILNFAPNGIVTLPSGETQSAGQINAVGTPGAPISILSSEDGVQSTLSQSSGTVNATYLILKDSEATGGATFNATQSLDNGNNTGWNITEIVPQDYYWVGGSGNWSDAVNHWSNTSGGAPSYTFAPGVLDNVFFDANSFSEDGQVVTLDSDAANCHDMMWGDIDQQVTFAGNGLTLNVYGSLQLAQTLIMGVNYINFLSPEIETFDPGFENGPGTNHYLTFAGGGVYSFEGEVTCRELILTAGTVDANGYDLWVDFRTEFQGNSSKVLNVEDITYYTRGLQWLGATADNLVLNGQNGTIECSSTFSPGNFGVDNIELNLNDLRFYSPGFADGAEIQSDITVNTLTIDPGKFFEIWNTTTVTCNQLICAGTADEPIVFQGGTEGVQGVISQASGVVNGEYLELRDIQATGGATFYANNSQDMGNVTGWIFTGQAQSINFDPVDDVLEDVGSFELTVSATSELPVTLEVLSGPATLDGLTVTITGPGPVVILASQAGDEVFNPAQDVQVEFCSNPLQPTITPEILEETVELTSSATDFNQWYNDFGVIEDATDQLFVATESGVYYVQVEVDGCISAPSDAYEVIIIGVEEELAPQWMVYPNPFNDFIQVQNDALNGAVELELFSADGRLVHSEIIPSLAGSIRLQIPGLASGQYILSLQTENHRESVMMLKR